MRSSIDVTIHPKATEILKCEEPKLPGLIISYLSEHSRLLNSKSNSVLKDAPESAVSIVNISGFPPVCVKEFRWRGLIHALKGLFRPTQGLRTFRNGWRLHECGVGASLPLALARLKTLGLVRSEWVIMELIPGALELDRYIVKRIASGWPQEEKRCLARLFGRFIGSLHAQGIFHADLKTCNILVSEDGVREDTSVKECTSSRPPTSFQSVRFSLVDYDDVTFGKIVPHKKRVKNLAQLFLSVPAAVRAAQRLRFLYEYAFHAGIIPKQRRSTAVDVLNACRGKNILYVGFSGDVCEKWENTRPQSRPVK